MFNFDNWSITECNMRDGMYVGVNTANGESYHSDDLGTVLDFVWGRLDTEGAIDGKPWNVYSVFTGKLINSYVR